MQCTDPDIIDPIVDDIVYLTSNTPSEVKAMLDYLEQPNDAPYLAKEDPSIVAKAILGALVVRVGKELVWCPEVGLKMTKSSF